MAEFRRLLERSSQAAEVEAAFRRMDTGVGTAIAVIAGAGAGKSAIVAATAAQARMYGCVVAQGRGSYGERHLPWALARNLFDSLLSAPGFEDAQLPAGRTAADLAAAIRQAASSAPSRRLVILVDNLQWADQQSLAWLSRLAESIDDQGFLLLATVCPGVEETDHHLLEEFISACMSLTPPTALSSQATADLIAELLGIRPTELFASECARLSAGNPLLATMLGNTLKARQIPPVDDNLARLDTLRVEELLPSVNGRLRRVAPEAPAIFRFAVVLDTIADLERLTELSGCSPELVADICARLEMLGLVTVGRSSVSVAQPLVRRAFVDGFTATEISEAHAQVTTLLERQGVRPEIIAEHLIAGNAGTGERMQGVLIRAAESALAGCEPDTAIRYLRQLSSEPPFTALDQKALRLLYQAAGHVDTPLALQAVIESTRRSLQDPAGTSPVDALDLRLALLTGTPPQVRVLLDATRKGLSGVPTADDGVLGLLLAVASREQPSVVTLGEALALKLLDDDDLRSEILRDVIMSAVHLAGRQYRDAEHSCSLAFASAAGANHRPILALVLAIRSLIHRASDASAAAADDARRSLELLSDAGVAERSSLTAFVLGSALFTFADAGSRTEVEVCMRRADKLVEEYRGLPRAALFLGLSYASLSLEDADQALGYLRRFPQQQREVVLPIRLAPSWHSLRAQALTMAGRNQDALQHAELLLSRTPAAVPEDLAHALRVRATADPAGFNDSLCQRAINLLTHTRFQGELSRCWYALGRAQHCRGQVEQARKTLHKAIRLARGVTLSNLELQIQTQLVAAGGRVQRPKPRGLAGLTKAELKVARMARQGCTNQQIAAHLSIGVRTVEIHLSRTYAKLGIAGRNNLPPLD